MDLMNLIDRVDIGKNPDIPERLSTPRVVIIPSEGPDEIGLHGAATNPGIEIKIWGYGDSMYESCWQAASIISSLMVLPLSGTSGVGTRVRAETGFQEAPTTDPRTIHLLCVYRMRFWWNRRVTVLAQS